MPQVCPHLPQADTAMSYRCLKEAATDSPAFYLNALKYGHYLWLNGHAGRALLALTRALNAPLPQEAPIYRQWPLPYAALGWIATHHDSDDFPGNPRISFQHQATRLKGERAPLRRARAWAVWAILCRARPGLVGDANDPVEEPDNAWIQASLREHGAPDEPEIWQQAMALFGPAGSET